MFAVLRVLVVCLFLIVACSFYFFVDEIISVLFPVRAASVVAFCLFAVYVWRWRATGGGRI